MQTQTNETIRQNIENWSALHANVESDKGLREYNADRIKKHKLRLIEAFRRSGRA